MYDPTAPEYQGMPKFIKIELNSLISYLGNLEITPGSCSENMRLMYRLMCKSCLESTIDSAARPMIHTVLSISCKCHSNPSDHAPDQVRDVQLVTLDIPIYTQTESFASMKFPTISTEC